MRIRHDFIILVSELLLPLPYCLFSTTIATHFPLISWDHIVGGCDEVSYILLNSCVEVLTLSTTECECIWL